MIATAMPKKKRRGPRPLPAAKKRSEQIRVLLTKKEKARIAAAAENAMRDMGDYLRVLALEDADRRLGPEE